uniref:Xylulose kinase-1 n=1 Tax=Tanacetum cinerariifolium TaxID=118510 RepID=A0A6L2MD38_TANCI|nr:hypothetical protein [Tanacetum cinerariifolium]
MANLTFADIHNMVVFLSKSDASASFDQIVEFLSGYVIQYALMVNPTIYVSCIKQLWATVLIKKANDVVKLRALVDGKRVNEFICSMASTVICLATGRKFNFSKYIFDSMVRNVDSPSKFLMYPRFLQVIINAQVDDLSSHNNQYISSTLTQKVFANMRRVEEEDDVEVPAAPTLSSPTIKPSPPLQEPITIHSQAQHAPPSSPLQEQPTTTSESSMPLLNTLMETCVTLRMHPNRGRIEAIDADEEINLVDIKTQADLGAELQGRKDDDNVAI